MNLSLFTEELGKLTPELELSLFQLGLSPQIAASILMQVNFDTERVKTINLMNYRLTLYYFILFPT